MSNEQAIIDLIQGQVDSIQNGLWPEDKFYVTRIMTNQREYGPLFFSKISKVLDSLALIPGTQLQWATIGEAFQYFQDWSMTSGIAYSQWSCGQTTTETHEIPKGGFQFFPNPFSGQATLHTGFPLRQANLSIANVYGQIVKQITGINEQTIILDRGNLPEGLYFLCLTQEGKIIATDKVLVANR